MRLIFKWLRDDSKVTFKKYLVLSQRVWIDVMRVNNAKSCVYSSASAAALITWLIEDQHKGRLHYNELEQVLLLVLPLQWERLLFIL